MKKLMLLPLLIMSTLVGCSPKQEEETIYTVNDWFDNTDVLENELNFYVDISEVHDYDKMVAQRLLKTFDIDFKYPKKVDKVDGYDLMSYTIKKEMGPYSELTIFIHERSIETRAEGTRNGLTIEQCVRYDTYGVLGTSLLITYAARRSDTIHNTKEAEHSAAREAGSLENFYKQIEESTTNPTVRFSTLSKEDVNHSLLDDIKDLEVGSNKGSGVNLNDNAFMTYGLSENFMLSFYLNNKSKVIGVLEYKYESSFHYTDSVRYCYEVSREKIDNLINKITGVANS